MTDPYRYYSNKNMLMKIPWEDTYLNTSHIVSLGIVSYIPHKEKEKIFYIRIKTVENDYFHSKDFKTKEEALKLLGETLRIFNETVQCL